MNVPRALLRVVAFLHLVAGVLMIPSSLLSAFFLGVALGVWLLVLGIGLWRARFPVWRAAVVTHWLIFVLAALMAVVGGFSLVQARLSFLHGNEILRSFGLSPLIGALLLALFATVSLLMLHHRRVLDAFWNCGLGEIAAPRGGKTRAAPDQALSRAIAESVSTFAAQHESVDLGQVSAALRAVADQAEVQRRRGPIKRS
jgi:hypothetical protein